MEPITLSEGEWKIMKLLWEDAPCSLTELTKALDAETGWTRPTVFVMLMRLIAKGAVRLETGGRVQVYYPTVLRSDIAPRETESFLNRVYDGSIGMLFSALTERHPLTEEEIRELRGILDRAEQKTEK